MDDSLTCPICGNKLRNQNLDKYYLTFTGQVSDFISRSCTQSINHYIRFYFNKKTNKVDLVTLSLNPKNSRYLDIDFVNKKCRIQCMKDGNADYINIPKMIVPDFPKLEKLKERVNMYVVFS